jgi:hypothetical protein
MSSAQATPAAPYAASPHSAVRPTATDEHVLPVLLGNEPIAVVLDLPLDGDCYGISAAVATSALWHFAH